MTTIEMLHKLSLAYTGNEIGQFLVSFGFKIPGRIAEFYYGNESPEYILTAAIVCCQNGE